MKVRGVVLVTIALFLGISALVLHLLAMCSPNWKKTTRKVEPILPPVSYGLWQRCEYFNHTVIKQGVTLGTRTNVEICWPNRYMRYPPEKFLLCYNIRRSCPVMETVKSDNGCSCDYLPSTKAMQWLTFLAAIFLILGLVLLHLKTIASPQNDSALMLLSYGPFICFLLALLLMVTGLVLIGAYLRRDLYEDYSFPLETLRNDTQPVGTFDLYSLRTYAKSQGSNLNNEKYLQAEKELMDDAYTHFDTTIGRATIYEIIAAALVFIITIFLLWLALASKSDDV